MAKAWKIENLNYEDELLTALSVILEARFNEMLSYEEGTIKGEDIEYLHSMRVASRRVQAVLKVFRNAYPPNKFKPHYETIKTIKDYLGEVRHYDVFVKMLEDCTKKYDEKDRKAIYLMIIRQNTIRHEKRKTMTFKLKELNKAGYKENFNNFVKQLKLKNEKKIQGKTRQVPA